MENTITVMKGRTRVRSESARPVPVKHRGVTMKGSTTIADLHRLLWISRLRVPRPTPITLLVTLRVGRERFRPLHASAILLRKLEVRLSVVLAKEVILKACSVLVTPKTTARTSTKNPPRELYLIQIKKGVASDPRCQHIASLNP